MALKKAEWIWFNGRLVPWDQAQVHVAAHVLHYGSSVFEGIRAYEVKNRPAVFCLDAHIARLISSARVVRMTLPCSHEEIKLAIAETIRANGHTACYIRPLAFRGVETLSVNPQTCPVEIAIMTWEWGAYLGPEALAQGIDVGVSSWRRMAPGTLPAVAKIGGQYINSQLVVMEAVEHGYVEGIALDVNGYVSEGSGENVFVVVNGEILTPALSSSILNGVTRRCIITLAEELGYRVRQEMIPRELLYMADEIFFTGTAAEITPVRSIDRIPVGAGRMGPVTDRLQHAFFDIVTGRVPDRHGWLTTV